MTDESSQDDDSERIIQEIKEWFSHGHLIAAELFEKKARRLEENPNSGIRDESSAELEHRISVIYSVMASTAFLEARINELYDEAVDAIETFPRHYNQEMGSGPIDDEGFMNLIKNLEEVGGRSFSHNPTLQKYQLILAYAGEEPFDRGRNPYQDANHVRELRNYFVHYDPEWRRVGEDDANEPHRLESALQGKFDLNPLADEDSVTFPNRMLSAGCAKWARESCREFAVEFLDRVGSTETHTFQKSRKKSLDGPFLAQFEQASWDFYSDRD